MNKKLLLTAAAVTIIGGGLLTSTQAFAEGEMGNSPVSHIVNKIATKFGLSESDVQAVFDEAQTEHQAQRQAEYQARLTQLVSDGKLTEAQKELIVAKHAELTAQHQSKLESWKDQTPAERRAAMDAERQDLAAWASQNGIDEQYVMFFGHGEPGFKGGEAGELPPETTAQ